MNDEKLNPGRLFEMADTQDSVLKVQTASILRSEELMQGKQQISILHNNDIYFLRQTRLGKLILTK